MADAKISALTALSAIDVADLLPVVDVSDTTDAATGTTKQITFANVIAPIFATPRAFTVTDTANTSVVAALTVRHTLSSGTPGTNLGAALKGILPSTTTADQDAGQIAFRWSDATHATRKGAIDLTAFDASGSPRIGVTVGSNGSATLVSFFNATPAVQQTGDVGTAAVTLGLMSGTPTFAAANLTGRTANNLVHLQDQKTAGTDGGTFTSGAWQTRTLNTEVVDTGGVCTLSSNQFQLTAGTYRIHARAPAFLVNNHQARLQNITDGTTTLTGSSMTANATYFGCNDSTVTGRFTIGGTKTFELQHRCSATFATSGMGQSNNFGLSEVYAEVWLEKEAS